MEMMRWAGRYLLAAGALLALLGALLLLADRISWIGRLPGDISVRGRNVQIYFPLGTCLLISAILTALLWLARGR